MPKRKAGSREAHEGEPPAVPSPDDIVPEELEEQAGSDDEFQAQNESFRWFNFVKEIDPFALISVLPKAIDELLGSSSELSKGYAIVALCDPKGRIGPFETDRLFAALSKLNSKKSRDVLLVLLSNGGSIEPAYQLSKLCRQYAKEKFVVVVPRQAKSAATLIAIGADEIHMGPLSQLGPIDPQLGNLPALGVIQALKTIASLAQDYPGSADMLSRYLRMVLTVEQIGYCERIGESAVQYAERLLSTKPALKETAAKIARELVYEYKDHGFVIDQEEAKGHLGEEWIRTDSRELQFGENLYRIFEDVELGLNIFHNKRLLLIGDVRSDFLIFEGRQG